MKIKEKLSIYLGTACIFLIYIIYIPFVLILLFLLMLVVVLMPIIVLFKYVLEKLFYEDVTYKDLYIDTLIKFVALIDTEDGIVVHSIFKLKGK